MVLDELLKHDKFVIFGSRVIAYGAYIAIKELTGRIPQAFVVTGEGDNIWSGDDSNPKQIEDVSISLVTDFSKDVFIIVAVTEIIQKEVLPWLDKRGYNNTFALTAHEEHLLMSAYYQKIGLNVAQESLSDDYVAKDFVLYEVKNDKDKPLISHHGLKSFEQSIQAGKALCDNRIADITDDSGDNISLKNRMYCEMSATYWVWKNKHHDWVGIEHYRRHLLVTPDMLEDDVDAIMPLPYICYPNEATQFRRFVSQDVFDVLLRVLQEMHPDKYDEYRSIIYGKYQYTYNLLCAKWEVFDEYCKWFFEICERMETYADSVPELVSTRALSYVAEVLTNIFFTSHRDSFRILHVEKEIYI